ncbi:MAG: hypothetical protein ABIF10_06950, partial [Candidatus Woesearchaeota archaeon]
MKTLLALIIFIVLAASAYAYPVQIDITGGDLYTQLASGSCTVQQSGNSYIVNGYGYCTTYEWVYGGCLPGYTGYTNTDDSNGYGPWPFNYARQKATNCQAEVCCLNLVPDRIRLGQTISVNPTIYSPLDFGAAEPRYAPSSIQHYYSVDVNTQFIIDGSTISTKNNRIIYGGSTPLSFSYTAQTCGTHTVTVKTTVPDCQCVTSLQDSVTDTFQVYVCELDSGWGDGHQYSCNADRTYNQCNGDGCGYSKVNLCEHNCGADYECDGIAPGQGNCDSQCKWHAVCGDGKISD